MAQARRSWAADGTGRMKGDSIAMKIDAVYEPSDFMVQQAFAASEGLTVEDAVISRELEGLRLARERQMSMSREEFIVAREMAAREILETHPGIQLGRVMMWLPDLTEDVRECVAYPGMGSGDDGGGGAAGKPVPRAPRRCRPPARRGKVVKGVCNPAFHKRRK